MKKLILGMTLSLVGFSALNAVELKCDSKEAMIAFAKDHFQLTTKQVNKLKKDGHIITGGFDWTDRDTKDIRIMFDGILIGDVKYFDFKLIKDNKTNKECEVSVRYPDVVDGTKYFFTLQQGLIANVTTLMLP